MKRMRLSVFATLLMSSSVVFASYKEIGFTPAIPYVYPGFEINAGPVWLQPGASNLNYVIYNKELPAQSPTWEEREIQPNYDLGFELGLRYVLQSGDKDVRLDWTHLSTNSSSSVAAPNDNFFLGPDYEIGPSGLPIRNAEGEAQFDYDVINLTLGQYQAFGQSVVLRYFMGLSGALLHEDVTTTYTGTVDGAFAGPFSTQQEVTSKFNGIGPQFGINANYYFYRGFGIVGEASATALIGAMHAKTNYTSSAPELLALYNQTQNYQYIKDESVMQVVPAINTKLGIDYKYPFGQTGLVTITAGYEAAVYINAISQYLPGSLVTIAPLETGGIFVATMDHTLSNYSVQGPFLDVAIHF